MDDELAALEELYRDRYSRFRDGLAPLVGSYDIAHDVVQDAFAQALVKRRGFRGEGRSKAGSGESRFGWR